MALKLILSIGLLALIAKNTDLVGTWEIIKDTSWYFIPLGVAFFALIMILSTLRWDMMARPLGFHLPIRRLYEMYFIGQFLCLFLPSSIGGDVGRMYLMAKETGLKKRHALITLIAERGMGFLGLMTVTAVALSPLFVSPLPQGLWLPFMGVVLVNLILILVLRQIPTDKLAKRWKPLELIHDCRPYWRSRKVIVFGWLYAIVFHIGMTALLKMIAYALGMDVSWHYIALTYGIVSLVTLLPISLNGLGLREGSFIKLLGLAGVSNETALAFSVYFLLITTLASLYGGWFMLRSGLRSEDLEDAEDELSESTADTIEAK